MKKIIQSLLPSANIIPHTALYHKNSLMCIHLDDDLFYITLNYSDNPNITDILKKQLQTISRCVHIDIFIMEDTPIDRFITDTKKVHIDFKNHHFQFIFSVEFLTYLAKKLSLIINTYHESTIKDFDKELFRYQPRLLDECIWNKMSYIHLSNLFNQMLSHNLVSLQMLAIFFVHIGLPSPNNYFSSRISEALNEEIKKINELPDSLTKVIYYIIERNILLFFKKKPQIQALEEYELMYHKRLNNFIFKSSKNIMLSSLTFIQKHHQSPQFYTFVNQLPYHELLSFLKISPDENTKIIKNAFSQEGQVRLLDDIQKSDIKPFNIILEKLGLFESQHSGESFETLLKKYITTERDWEFLAREINLPDMIILINNIEKQQIKNLSPILKSLVTYDNNKQIIFDNYHENNLQTLYPLASSKIYYLNLLSLLDHS
ncbi:MAG: hypothetical protein ACRCV0_02845 [Brevinema sp.]